MRRVEKALVTRKSLDHRETRLARAQDRGAEVDKQRLEGAERIAFYKPLSKKARIKYEACRRKLQHSEEQRRLRQREIESL